MPDIIEAIYREHKSAMTAQHTRNQSEFNIATTVYTSADERCRSSLQTTQHSTSNIKTRKQTTVVDARHIPSRPSLPQDVRRCTLTTAAQWMTTDQLTSDRPVNSCHLMDDLSLPRRPFK